MSKLEAGENTAKCSFKTKSQVEKFYRGLRDTLWGKQPKTGNDYAKFVKIYEGYIDETIKDGLVAVISLDLFMAAFKVE